MDNKLCVAALVVAVLVGGLFLGSKTASQPSSPTFSCGDTNLTNNGGSTSIPASASEQKFGAVEYSSFGVALSGQSVSSTGGSFVTDASVITLGVTGGTVATGTRTSVTSTIAVPGRFCQTVVSSTGTQQFITVAQGGGFVFSNTPCSP